MITVYEDMTDWLRFSWRKNGPFNGHSSEDEYVEYHLQEMSRNDFLYRLSDAIETRLSRLESLTKEN